MFFVCILGNSSAIPANGRYLSSQLLVYNYRQILFDCGEATQFQIRRYRFGFKRLDAIFISHLHGDHVYGLPGLIATLSLSGRIAPLLLVGPKGIKELLYSTFKITQTEIRFELNIFEIEPDVKDLVVYETDNYTVNCFPLDHRIQCHGYRVTEKPKKRKFLVEKAYTDGIPKEFFHLIKAGNTVTLPNGEKVMPDPYLGDAPTSYSYAYCSDTAYNTDIIPCIDSVDLLYHEATFEHALIKQADLTKHSTAIQAAEIAKAANVKKLIIGHFSARYKTLDVLLNEARTVFPESFVAEEGKYYYLSPKNDSRKSTKVF